MTSETRDWPKQTLSLLLIWYLAEWSDRLGVTDPDTVGHVWAQHPPHEPGRPRLNPQYPRTAMIPSVVRLHLPQRRRNYPSSNVPDGRCARARVSETKETPSCTFNRSLTIVPGGLTQLVRAHMTVKRAPRARNTDHFWRFLPRHANISVGVVVPCAYGDNLQDGVCPDPTIHPRKNIQGPRVRVPITQKCAWHL